MSVGCSIGSKVKSSYFIIIVWITSIRSIMISLGLAIILLARVVGCSEIGNEPKLMIPTERVNHQEGTNATFTCSVGSGDLNGLTYEWRKDDMLINLHSNPRKLKINIAPENYRSELRVIDLKPNDAGIYSCVAKNRYGQDKVATQLTVKVELKWTVKPKDVEIGAGKPLHVACSADGIPKPWIEWSKAGTNEKSQNILIGPELRFGAVNQQDAGVYECRAKNGVEKDLVTQISLNVLGK